MHVELRDNHIHVCSLADLIKHQLTLTGYKQNEKWCSHLISICLIVNYVLLCPA
jgi:hypothetical protein